MKLSVYIWLYYCVYLAVFIDETYCVYLAVFIETWCVQFGCIS